MMRRFFQSTIRQGGAALPFVFEINTANTSTGSSTATQFRLPLQSVGTYDFDVDWGDSTSDNITAWNVGNTHTYASAGTYTITITGTIIGWSFAATGDRLKILDITQWGILRFITNSNFNIGFFRLCSNLQVSAIDSPDFTDCTAIDGMFYQCTALTGNSSFNDWNTTGITSMNSVFRSCPNFNQPINNWDVSLVTNMASMFQSATVFNQPLNSWNTGNVTDFSAMFLSATNFNGNISSWNTSNAQTMLGMFSIASNFNQDISGWNVSNVTIFGSVNNGMFFRASAFNQPIGSWDVSSATTMFAMFQLATAFNQNIGSWNVSNVTNFTNFMASKTNLNYSAANLDAIYNGWSSLPSLQSGISISFGTIKYTAAGQAGRDVLTGAPNNWIIADGGI